MSNHVNEMVLEQCYEEVMTMTVEEFLNASEEKCFSTQSTENLISDLAEELFVDRSE